MPLHGLEFKRDLECTDQGDAHPTVIGRLNERGSPLLTCSCLFPSLPARCYEARMCEVCEVGTSVKLSLKGLVLCGWCLYSGVGHKQPNH